MKRRPANPAHCFLFLILCAISGTPLHGDIVTVLFTGFNPSNPSGMDELNQTLTSNFAADYPNRSFSSQVFEWNQRQQAFDYINNFNEIDRLFMVGHSWGGNALIRVAQERLLPNNMGVDATFQIDSVDIFDPGLGDDVLPPNVGIGYNYYQLATGLFEPQGEMSVLGAVNINVEALFNDPGITHASIDNDTRLHDLIYLNMQSTLIPEPGSLFLLVAAGLGLFCFVRRSRVRQVVPVRVEVSGH